MISPELYIQVYGIGTLSGITIIASVVVWRWLDEVAIIREYEIKAKQIIDKYGSNNDLIKELTLICDVDFSVKTITKFDVEFQFDLGVNHEEVMAMMGRYGYKSEQIDGSIVTMSRKHLYYN